MFNCSTISMFTLSSHCLFMAPPIGLGPTFRCPLWHQWQIWSPPPQRSNIVQSCVDLVRPKTQVSLWKCHRFRQSSPAGFPGAWNWRRRRNISHCSLVSFMVALHSIYSILRHPHLSFIYMKSIEKPGFGSVHFRRKGTQQRSSSNAAEPQERSWNDHSLTNHRNFYSKHNLHYPSPAASWHWCRSPFFGSLLKQVLGFAQQHLQLKNRRHWLWTDRCSTSRIQQERHSKAQRNVQNESTWQVCDAGCQNRSKTRA